MARLDARSESAGRQSSSLRWAWDRGVLVGVGMGRSAGFVDEHARHPEGRSAAYLPIDPDLPPDRRDFLIADARLSWILVDAASREAIGRTSARIVDIDADEQAISRESRESFTYLRQARATSRSA